MRNVRLTILISLLSISFHRVESFLQQQTKTSTLTSKTSLFQTSSDNIPFFAIASTTPKTTSTSDSNAASITTRVPLGSLFDSRDYIFETLTNVRGYEWTLKEADELLDDFIDASNGYLNGIYDNVDNVPSSMKHDYELSQIVLVPMDWDREKYGLGNRYDVFDGQQRLVSLCLIFSALRESFRNEEGLEETITELSNMLKPPKVRKAEIVRIELHKRDNEILSLILNDDTSKLEMLHDLKMLTRANRRILENHKRFVSRIGELSVDERIKLLDFMVENVYMLVCIPESQAIARNLVTAQGKGMDNEPIDDFKGLLCFRYIQNEDNMYKTFDSWDQLASTPDIDNGSVGRDTVSDACLLRATALLRNKIRKRDILLGLERWLRHDILVNKREGDIFFKKKIETASLTLGQYRTGNFHLFGFYSRSKDTKIWTSILMRLNFLREMTTTVTSVKDLEMVILDLLLRACGTEGESTTKMSLKDFDQQLYSLEILALWMALSKPTGSIRYQKCFEFLNALESGDNDINLLFKEDKAITREALFDFDFGSTASGKKVAAAIIKRINCDVQTQGGQGVELFDSIDHHLEFILPVKASKKTWGQSWPDSNEMNKLVNKIGNLAIVSNKPTASDAKKAFTMKKERFKVEKWPLTMTLAELEDWNSDSLIKNTEYIVNLIDGVWRL